MCVCVHSPRSSRTPVPSGCGSPSAPWAQPSLSLCFLRSEPCGRAFQLLPSTSGRPKPHPGNESGPCLQAQPPTHPPGRCWACSQPRPSGVIELARSQLTVVVAPLSASFSWASLLPPAPRYTLLPGRQACEGAVGGHDPFQGGLCVPPETALVSLETCQGPRTGWQWGRPRGAAWAPAASCLLEPPLAPSLPDWGRTGHLVGPHSHPQTSLLSKPPCQGDRRRWVVRGAGYRVLLM